MSELRKEIKELKGDIDKLIEPLQHSMDLYFGGYKELVEVEPFIQQQFRVINFLRQIQESYANRVISTIEENNVLRGLLLATEMGQQLEIHDAPVKLKAVKGELVN